MSRRSIFFGRNAHPYCAEAKAIFAAMSAQTATRRALINRTVTRLVQTGLWPLIDSLYVPAASAASGVAADILAAAVVDWRKPARTMTPVNVPTLTEDRGFVGDTTTSYCNSNYIPSTDAVALSVTSVTLGIYSRTTHAANTRFQAGTGTSTGGNNIEIANLSTTGNSLRGGAMTGLNPSATIPSTSLGLSAASRVGSVLKLYKDGALIDTPAAPTLGTVLLTGALFICGNNNAGTPATLSNDQIALCWIGGGFTDQQHADFKAIMVDGYLASVGAA